MNSNVLSFHFCLENVKIMWMLLIPRKVSRIMTVLHLYRTEQLTQSVPIHYLIQSPRQAQVVMFKYPSPLQWGCPWQRSPLEGRAPQEHSWIFYAKREQRMGSQLSGLEACCLDHCWHQLWWLIWHCGHLTGPLDAQTFVQALFWVCLRRCFWMKLTVN